MEHKLLRIIGWIFLITGMIGIIILNLSESNPSLLQAYSMYFGSLLISGSYILVNQKNMKKKKRYYYP